jgi:hypothetical protein
MQTLIAHKGERSVEGDEQRSRNALNRNVIHGKMTVYIRSRNTIVATSTMHLPQSSNRLTPIAFSVQKRIAVYERVLDEDQKAIVEMSTELARSMGVELEVKDEGKLGFSQLLGMIFRNHPRPKAPSVSFTGDMMTLMRGRSYFTTEGEFRRMFRTKYEVASKA